MDRVSPRRFQVAERLATAFRVLPQHRLQGASIQTIADELGVSERTAYRYVSALEAAYLATYQAATVRREKGTRGVVVDAPGRVFPLF